MNDDDDDGAHTNVPPYTHLDVCKCIPKRLGLMCKFMITGFGNFQCLSTKKRTISHSAGINFIPIVHYYC